MGRWPKGGPQVTNFEQIQVVVTRRPPLPLGKTEKITSGFPLGLENGKAGSSQGKSPGIFNRLEKSVKITQNIGKAKEFPTNVFIHLFIFMILK